MGTGLNELLLRPISSNDLQELYNIATSVGPGFTSLPADLEYLKQKIIRSEQSFAKKLDKDAGLYLLVMEDLTNKNIAGICGVEAKVGYFEPFYNYKVSTITQRSEKLDKTLDHQIMQLVNDFQPASEMVSLFLHPSYRGDRRGEFLSRARFIFIAKYRELFSDLIIAELRGVSDNKGSSPFWDALGRAFFDMDFVVADKLTTIQGKQFIADLIPQYPIYLELLPQKAIEVIGKTHIDTQRAMQFLLQENFEYRGYVDIFDAGPLIEAKTDNIATIKHTQKAEIAKIVSADLLDKTALITNADLKICKITCGKLAIDANKQLLLDAATAKVLQLKTGDFIYYCLF